MKRYGKGLLVCLAAAVGAAVMLGSTCSVFNKAPTVPVISGPSAGVVGVPVTFKATATDPESDSIAFQFDWGDTTTKVWSNLIAPGETTSIAHTYSDAGTFSVKAKAKDAKGKESGWCAAESVRISVIERDYPDSLVGDIALPYDDARATAVTADGQFLYVAYAESDFVTPIRLQDRTVLPTVRVGFIPYDMVSSPSGDHMYITCSAAHKLCVLRTQDNVVEADVQLSDDPKGLAVTPDGRFIYICIWNEERLVVVRTADNTIVDSVRLGDVPKYAAVAPSGSTLYVTMGANGHVGVVDLVTNTLVDSVSMGQFPQSLVVSPNGEHVYVTNQPDSGLAVIRTADNAVVARVNVHAYDLGPVAVTPDGKYVFVTSRRQDGMCVVDAQTNTEVDSLPYGFGWYGVHPDGDTVYVPRLNLVHVLGRRK